MDPFCVWWQCASLLAVIASKFKVPLTVEVVATVIENPVVTLAAFAFGFAASGLAARDSAATFNAAVHVFWLGCLC